MSKLDKFFKYEIGDIVATRGNLHQVEWVKPLNDRSVPQALVVVGRQLDECHGGIQMHYLVRAHTFKMYEGGGFTLDCLKLAEPELIAYPAPPKALPKPKRYENKAALMKGVAMVARATKKG